MQAHNGGHGSPLCHPRASSEQHARRPGSASAPLHAPGAAAAATPPHSRGRSAVSFLAFLPPQRSPSAPARPREEGARPGASERTFLRRARR